MKTKLIIILLPFIILGCSLHEEIKRETKLEIPIILMDDDTNANSELVYDVIEKKLYDNSMLKKCGTEEKDEGVCIKIRARGYEYSNEVRLTYFNFKNKHMYVSAHLPITKKYQTSRGLHLEIKKRNEDSDLIILGAEDTQEIDVESLRGDKEDIDELEKESGFTLTDLTLIQKDISNLHNPYILHRFLRDSNE